MTPDPKTEALKPRYWQTTDDFPKVGTLWVRGKGDYREHLVVGFAHPVAYVTASCGCQPILCSDHVSDWRMENMEWSENRRDWFDCSIEGKTHATAANPPDRIIHDYAQKRIAELEAGAAAMREALCQILRNNCTIITEEIASEALNSSTAGTDFAERLRKAEEERDKLKFATEREYPEFGYSVEWREGRHWVHHRDGGDFLWNGDPVFNAIHCARFSAQITALKTQLAAVTAERDAIQHIIDCANTPLMRDVLAERDALAKAIQDAPHAMDCSCLLGSDLKCDCWKASALGVMGRNERHV